MYDRYGEDGVKSTVGGQSGAYAVLPIIPFSPLFRCKNCRINPSILFIILLYCHRQIHLISLRPSLEQVWEDLLVVMQLDSEDAVPLLLLKAKIYGEFFLYQY